MSPRSFGATCAAGLSAAALSACATPTHAQHRVDAVLTDTSDSAVRSAIRSFVRDDGGPMLVADLDSLSLSPALPLRRRERPDALPSRMGATDLAATPTYRLVMRPDTSDCWVIRVADDFAKDREVRLPDGARCVPYAGR